MASYLNGKWSNLNLATNQRRTGNNPYLKGEFTSQFPDKSASDWEQFWPVSSGAGNFITNGGSFANWVTTTNDPNNNDWPRWTLKTDTSEWADQFPDDRTTSRTIYVAYDNSTDTYTGGIGYTKEEAKQGGGNKVIRLEVNNETSGLRGLLKDQKDPSGNPISGHKNVVDALRERRDELRENNRLNEQAEGQRQAAMDSWNQTNVYQPANTYSQQHNSTGQQWRSDSATAYNESLDADDGPRQAAADNANAQGEVAYNYANGLNNWSKSASDWAKGSQTGLYTENRSHIFANNGLRGSLTSFANSINQQAANAGLGVLIDANTISETLNGMKNSYGAYYANERIDSWNGQTDGGTYDLIGQFDNQYYLNQYGDSRGINEKWARAVQYGDPNSPLDPNNDLDVTARFGSIQNLAWYDYSNGGKTDGARGSEASETTQADNYNESWDSKTDAEKATIRDQIFGLTGEGETIEWGTNILDPTSDATVSFLEGKVGELFAAEDLEQQDKFGGLAQDVLKKSVDELRKQQENERQMDIFRGLPGFSEIYDSNKTLVNSLLGDSGIGGYLGMMGVNTRDVASNLEDQIEGITGISNNNAQFNWNRWMEGELKPYYENLDRIEGMREDEAGNKVTYDLTAEEGRQFITKFIDEYITPRFNMSKSMSEFVSYLDTLDEDEQNIFQTQTAMNKLQQTAELSAKQKFNELVNSSDTSVFDADYYFDPTSVLEGATAEELENNYMNVADTLKKYERQRDTVNRDWATAKSNPSSKAGLSGTAAAYSWEQWAYFYGVDINDKNQFAKLHFQVTGAINQFDPAKDIVGFDTVNNYFKDVLLPLVEQEKISLDDAAFMEFVTPEEFATAMLDGIDPLENEEEWKKVLEQFGIENMDASLEEVKEYIKEAFETGEAQAIREGIKYLNERKEEINQETLGVDYIERDPKEILGEEGDIEVGSQAWRDLMISYNLSGDLTYAQATNALLDREEIDAETTNPLYEIFSSNGYAGTQDDFIRDFFPDASREELADLNFVGQALQGGMSLTDISSDPFTAMSQFEGFLGGSDRDLYGVDSDRDFESESNYFDLFPDEEDYASNTGRGIIDSWTGGLFG